MSRLTFDLGKIGVAVGKVPDSLAVCFTFLSEFRKANDSQQLFLHAAAIGACNQTDKLPRYPYAKGDPLSYGFQVTDMLLKEGITPAQIMEMGSDPLVEMFNRAMGIFQAEVTEKENFSSPIEVN